MALTETTEFTESLSIVPRCSPLRQSASPRRVALGTIFSSMISVRSSGPDSSERSEERVRKQSHHGFTLIEILVALIVMTVTVSVVLGSQLVALKIEQKARTLQMFRFETQRIFSATHRAKNELQLMELLSAGGLGRVKSELVRIESGTNVLILIKHELSTDPPSSSRPPSRSQRPCYGGGGFSSVFYTRFPDYPGRRSDAIGGSGSR